MIELFGFWASVTIHTALLSGLILVIGYIIGCYFCDYVTEKTGVLRDKVLNYLKENYTEGSLYGARDLLGNILAITSITSVVTWFVTIAVCCETKDTLIGVVSMVAELAAPFLTWPALIISVLLVVAKGARKIYRMWSKLEAKLKAAE